jgi:hypothetical protein
MKGGWNVEKLWEACLVLQQSATAAASTFNALYFLHYSSKYERRRWGAFALVLVSLALLFQSIYFGLLPCLAMPEAGLFPGIEARFAVGLMPLGASLLISVFILKRRKHRR